MHSCRIDGNFPNRYFQQFAFIACNRPLITAIRGHLNFNFHTGVGQARGEHHRRWPDIAEIFARNRKALGKVVSIRQHIGYAHDILQAAAGFLQCGFNIFEALFGLLYQVVGYGHVAVVKSSGAGNQYPVACADRAGIADFLLEC
jgi:hypothetical protein